jgi:tight adherence protein C
MSPIVSLQAVRVAVIATVALTVGLVVFALAGSPSLPSNRLGLRGLKRQRAVARSSLWRAVEPVVRWLGVRVGGVVSESLRAQLDRQIALAGDILGLTAEEYVALTMVSALGGALAALGIHVGSGVDLSLALVLCVLLGALLPYLQISGAGQDRLVAIGRGLPTVVDVLAMTMSAGMDFPGAVRQVVEKAPNADDPIIEELTLLLQGLQVGRSRREVLEELGRRAPCDAVREFTGAVVQAEIRGNPLADVLQIQAATYRVQRSLKSEEEVSKAGVRMTAPLFLVFAAVLLLVMGPLVVKMASLQE